MIDSKLNVKPFQSVNSPLYEDTKTLLASGVHFTACIACFDLLVEMCTNLLLTSTIDGEDTKDGGISVMYDAAGRIDPIGKTRRRLLLYTFFVIMYLPTGVK